MSSVCGVYVITNKLNNRQYVGVSKNPHTRLKQHANPRKKTKSIITNAIKHHGLENFEIKILFYADRKYCFEMESKIISLFNTQTPNGYNICSGGIGANGLCGEYNGMYGKKGELSPQYGKVGKDAAFFGKKHTEETKQKMRLSHSGQKRTDETKELIRKIAIEKWKNPVFREKVARAKLAKRIDNA